MEPLLRDPKHRRNRAAIARAIAERLANPKSKQRMLGIANEYEKLAKLAEIRANA
jgi:ribosomal protein L18E